MTGAVRPLGSRLGGWKPPPRGLFGEGDEDGFLGVEAVFGFLEDGVGVEFEDLLGDFLAAVGGEAVEDDVAGGRSGE